MPRLLFLIAAIVVLAGCSGPVSSAPPESRIDVGGGYAEDLLANASLTVVVGEVSVTDEGVAVHLGGTTEDMGGTYRAFFSEALPGAFETARVGEVRIVNTSALGVSSDRPANGDRVAGADTDYVLLLDTLHVDRATYYGSQPGTMNPQTGMMTTVQTKSENLRIDTAIVLWDNTRGALVAEGQLDTQRALGLVGRGRGAYEAAVREFVEQLARFTPLALRE